MFVPPFQWLSNPLHQAKGTYTNIECKQVMHDVLAASRHVYGHKNTALRTEMRLKRQHCAIPVCSCSVRHTRVDVSIYAASSKEIKLMIIKLTGHTAGNIYVLYEWKFQTISLWIGYTILLGWPHSISVLSGVRYGKVLKSCMPFSMTSVTH